MPTPQSSAEIEAIRVHLVLLKAELDRFRHNVDWALEEARTIRELTGGHHGDPARSAPPGRRDEPRSRTN